jgi:thiol-disulfide isomerase/thioredoxin
MNKNILIGVVAVAVLAGGVGIYAANNASGEKAMMAEKKMLDEKALMEKTAMGEGSDTMMKKDEGATMEKGDTMMKSGSYESYGAPKVAMASATKDVVLFFKASWCPSCVAVDKDIKANLNAIPESLTILEVDYDTSTELKKKYGVTTQHTFVQVDAQGNLIKKWSGSPTLVALVGNVQ